MVKNRKNNNNGGRRTKKAVGYIRVSSDSQEDNTSLEDQKKRIEAYIVSQGWKYTKTYSDVGSGKNIERDGLKKLLDNLDKIDYVVVLKLDRLSRKLLDILDIIQNKFDENNVSLVSVTEPFDTSTPQGRLLLNMLGGFAEYERELISERVKSGKRAKKKQQGRTAYIHGAPKLGKKTKNGYLVDDKEEANLVRLIKRHRKDGKTYQQIADYLTEKNYPTKRGGRWQKTTIKYICEGRKTRK